MIPRFKPKLIPTLATLVLFPFLMSLGFWQLHRAEFKRELIKQYQDRSKIILTITDLDQKSDARYYQLKTTGTFDNQHSLLIDNKIYQHKVGYELITPLHITNTSKYLLIDRGFIPQTDRTKLPVIEPITGQQTITGVLLPTDNSGFKLGKDVFNNQWPWRIQALDLAEITKILGRSFYPYLLAIHPQQLNIATLRPERHTGYAVQWFALAGTLIIIFVGVNLVW